MRFASRFLIPVLLIVVSTSAVLVGGLYWLTAKQDRMEWAREHQSVQASLAAQVDFMGKLGMDYAVWDDMVRHSVLAFDRDWIDRNFGDYVFGQYGFDYSFVVRPDGTTSYGLIKGEQSAAAVGHELGNGYELAASQILRDPSGTGRLAGLTMSSGGLAVFAVAAIRPNSDQLKRPAGPPHRLVMAKLVGPALLGELSQRSVGLSLAVTGKHLGDSAGRLPLKYYDGQRAGTIVWTPHHPGSDLRRAVTPWLAFLLLTVAALATLVLRRAWVAACELVAGEARARHLAHHDALTMLPNRRAFTEHLLGLAREKRCYAVLYIDLDGFKEINDVFGHLTGDRLLQHTAERLLRASPRGSYLARLGGDEFAVVIHENFEVATLDKVAGRILEVVGALHDFGGEPIAVGASIGIAIANSDMADQETVRRADVAMYAAKNSGRNRWCHYAPELDGGRWERKLLEGELRRAIMNGDISVVFQPIVRSSDRAVMAMEALARWTHPGKGPISPDVFIPVAEESGAIIELGRYILREACLAARAWPYKLAVNLSPAQFWDARLVEGVLDILAECDFPPERLEFEITETYLLRRPEPAAEIIARLRKEGIRVALDDFGTGYASIGYLRRFELDLVKLDRSFVEHVAEDANAAEIAHAVIALGSALKLPILAEGVETESQAAILATAGCSFMQGWHYGRPQPASVIDLELCRGTRIAS